MRQQTIRQLGFEPGGFWRHYVIRVGDGHQCLEAGREQGESYGHFAAINAALQLTKPAYATDEVDAFVETGIADAPAPAQAVDPATG